MSSALKDDTNEPKKRKETRTKPTKMARKKSTLRMTRTTTDTLPTYNFYYTLATATKSQSRGSRHGPHATRSCPASNREGGGDRRPGVASPRRTRALARCTQHESTVYQRRVSSEGSSSKKPALMRANFLMKLNDSFAMKPCLSNARALKSNGCSRCPVFRSNTGCSEFLRLAHSSATLPALFSQPRYV